MGYHPEYTNFFGMIAYTEEDHVDDIDEYVERITKLLENHPKYFFDYIGGFDGADSRIDPFDAIIGFRKYTLSKTLELDGDIRGTPTEDEIKEFEQFCKDNDIDLKSLFRDARCYIV
jgi:hypothetical protein